MAEHEEQVLVIERSLFDQLGAFEGLGFNVEAYLPAILTAGNNRFVPRSLAEDDPSLKQIIPYAIFTHNGRILHYLRGKKGGEARLHAKESIGIGGHVNSGDASCPTGWDAATYDAAVRREVGEELRIASEYSQRVVALLNDDSNPVGRVHLGVVHLFHLESDDVQSNEPEITNLQFLTPQDLLSRRHHLESWSQICVDQLASLLATPDPIHR